MSSRMELSSSSSSSSSSLLFPRRRTTQGRRIAAAALFFAMITHLLLVGQVAAFVAQQQQHPLSFVALLSRPRSRFQQLSSLASSSSSCLFVLSQRGTTTDPENVFAAVDDEADDDDDDDDSWKTGFEDDDEKAVVEYLQMTLPQHKPLGCSVEESLAGTTMTVDTIYNSKDDNGEQQQQPQQQQQQHYVFVNTVVDGGHAQKAGLLPGDVIIGVTDTFGQEVENVAGMGIGKVKSLVAARPETEALQLRIARGTTVVQEHEQALAELCSNGAADEVAVENCVLEFLQSGYHDASSTTKTASSASAEEEEEGEECDPLTEEDCLLDQMHNMWAEDMPVLPTDNNEKGDDDDSPKKEKVKPWSSRSSPSGTFVRDPQTGEMRNIDA